MAPPSSGSGLDRPPQPAPPAPAGASTLAMNLFLLALGMFFAASIIGFLVIRSRQPEWPPAGSPPLPMGLWLATAVLLFSSAAAQYALWEVRSGNQKGLRVGLVATLGLTVLFLVTQALNWSALVARGLTPGTDLFGFAFYMLTGLHAVHVIGGVILLTFVSSKAARGDYSAVSHAGVRSAAVYTHFLTVVWVVMFALVFIV